MLQLIESRVPKIFKTGLEMNHQFKGRKAPFPIEGSFQFEKSFSKIFSLSSSSSEILSFLVSSPTPKWINPRKRGKRYFEKQPRQGVHRQLITLPNRLQALSPCLTSTATSGGASCHLLATLAERKLLCPIAEGECELDLRLMQLSPPQG